MWVFKLILFSRPIKMKFNLVNRNIPFKNQSSYKYDIFNVKR